MNVYNDVEKLKKFGEEILTPFLMKLKDEYEIGYLLVSLGNNKKNCLVINKVVKGFVRRGEDLVEISVDHITCPVELDCEESIKEFAASNLETYCSMIDKNEVNPHSVS